MENENTCDTRKDVGIGFCVGREIDKDG